MKRICLCDRCGINEDYKKGDCRLCWLYHNDESYRNYWEEPTTLEKTTFFLKNLKKRIVSNFEDASQEEIEKRLQTCDSCEFKTQDWKCTRCGCSLLIKTKWATSDCPLGRWPLQILGKKDDAGCAGCNKQG